MQIMDDIIAMGYDSLHPVQESSGMDPQTVKDKYGSQITIYGSLDVIDGLLAYEGDALDEYITRRFEIYAPGGGFIYNTGPLRPARYSAAAAGACLWDGQAAGTAVPHAMTGDQVAFPQAAQWIGSAHAFDLQEAYLDFRAPYGGAGRGAARGRTADHRRQPLPPVDQRPPCWPAGRPDPIPGSKVSTGWT